MVRYLYFITKSEHVFEVPTVFHAHNRKKSWTTYHKASGKSYLQVDSGLYDVIVLCLEFTRQSDAERLLVRAGDETTLAAQVSLNTHVCIKKHNRANKLHALHDL